MSEVRGIGKRLVCRGKDADHAARPDVSLGLWTSESGIPSDPPTTSVTSGSAGCEGWPSNLTPRLNPKMIPRMNPQRKTLYLQMIFLLLLAVASMNVVARGSLGVCATRSTFRRQVGTDRPDCTLERPNVEKETLPIIGSYPSAKNCQAAHCPAR
jgi:hypothetical protein